MGCACWFTYQPRETVKTYSAWIYNLSQGWWMQHFFSWVNFLWKFFTASMCTKQDRIGITPFFEHFNFTSLLSEELHMKRGLDMHNFSVIKATLEREEVAFQGSCLFISDWNTTFPPNGIVWSLWGSIYTPTECKVDYLTFRRWSVLYTAMETI